jgi:hypothetical protein
MRDAGKGDRPRRARGRPTAWLAGAAWAAAALLLYWLQPALGATYLVASGWVAAGGVLVWALVRWPAFRRAAAARRRGGAPPGSAPGG